MQWTASQMIAVLIARLGGGDQTFTIDELRSFKSSLPCVFTTSTDGATITVTVQDAERLPNAMQ